MSRRERVVVRLWRERERGMRKRKIFEGERNMEERVKTRESLREKEKPCLSEKRRDRFERYEKNDYRN